MSKKTFYEKYYAPLPGWGKAMVWVGGGIAAYTVYNLIADHIARAGSRKSVSEFNEDLTELENNGVFPSFTDSQYAAWANEIQESFSGCDPLNLSSFTLIAVLKSLKNDADFAKLVTAWGVRTYPDCVYGTVSGDLYTAVNSELNVLDRGSCNRVLRERDISYRF